MDEKKVKASRLGHDSHGTYVGPWDPKNPNTWHDVMGNEYWRCNSCGRFLLVSCFPHVATRDLMNELERRGFVRSSSYNYPKDPEENLTLTVTLTHTSFTNLNELV